MMSLCDPVLPGFDVATVCWVDFVMAAKVRDDAGIWKPLATLRRPAARGVGLVVTEAGQGRRVMVEPFSVPHFAGRRREREHRA